MKFTFVSITYFVRKVRPYQISFQNQKRNRSNTSLFDGTKVSIIPRGKSLGAAWYLPEEKQLRTKTEFQEHLCATLGGRASEEIVFGEPTSGSLDDLEKVTKEAYMTVAYFGSNKNVGTISFYDSTGQRDLGFIKPYATKRQS